MCMARLYVLEVVLLGYPVGKLCVDWWRSCEATQYLRALIPPATAVGKMDALVPLSVVWPSCGDSLIPTTASNLHVCLRKQCVWRIERNADVKY